MRRWILSLCLLALFSSASAFAEKTPTATEAWGEINTGAIVVDVRSPEEFAAGHIEGAINIPHDKIAERAAEISADKSKEIVLYCRSGHRAGLAQATLASLGFNHLTNAGGYQDLLDSK